MKKIMLSTITMGTLASMAPLITAVSCGKKTEDTSKSIIVYADTKGATADRNAHYWSVVKEKFDAWKKTNNSDVDLVIKYGKTEEINDKAEKIWGQFSGHTPDLIYAGNDHKSKLLPWAHKFTPAEVKEWTDTTQSASDMAFPTTQPDEFYALKTSAETTYQYLKYGKGILTHVNKPTTPAEALTISSNINARLQGKEVAVAGANTVANGAGKPIVLSNAATLPTAIHDWDIIDENRTYMHFPFLSAQSVYYTAYANALAGHQIDDTKAITDAALTTYAQQANDIALKDDGHSLTPNDMLYKASDDSNYKSVISKPSSDATAEEIKANENWKKIIREWYYKVKDQATPGDYSANFNKLLFGTTDKGHGGYYPNSAFNFIQQQKPDNTEKYDAYEAVGFEFQDIQIKMAGFDSDKKEAPLDRYKDYLIVRQPRFWYHQDHDTGHTKHLMNLRNPNFDKPLWINSRAWDKKHVSKQTALKALSRIIFSDDTDIIRSMYNDLGSIFVKSDKQKAALKTESEKAEYNTSYEGVMNSERINVAKYFEPEKDELRSEWTLGRNSQYGTMWGVWPDKSGFMMESDDVWQNADPTTGLNNLYSNFESNIATELNKING